MSSEIAGDFEVVLQSYLSEEKIRVISAVSNLCNLGMSQANELVERAPVVIKTRLSEDAANAFKADLESGYWPGMRNFERLPPGERCCSVEVRPSEGSVAKPAP